MELKGWLLFEMKSLMEAAAGTRERVRLLGIGERQGWSRGWRGVLVGITVGRMGGCGERHIREGVWGPCQDTDGSLGNSAVRGVSVLAVVLVTPPHTHTYALIACLKLCSQP